MWKIVNVKQKREMGATKEELRGEIETLEVLLVEAYKENAKLKTKIKGLRALVRTYIKALKK